MRKIFFLILLAASFAVPYFLLERRGAESLVDRFYGRDGATRTAGADSFSSPDNDPAADTYAASAPSAVPITSASYRPHPLLELAPLMNLEDVLSFRITPAWVLARWPQVTTGLKRDNWFGYRVPLVTGTDQNDITGSLTYYFGPTQQLQQLTLEGDTGDARRLVNYLTTQVGLQAAKATEQGVYLYRKQESDQVVSELRLRPENVAKVPQGSQRFQISLVLNRPPPARKSFLGF
ncbi:MAG: hypothetical protein GTO03_16955 [Planctomycetales bacterium]|nr:hypothetical protein [Planctomycetales bacterium]